MSSEDFKALQEKWREKLKKSGFIDHERPDGTLIHTDEASNYAAMPQECRLANEAFYDLVTRYLETAAWKNKVDKRIWSLHFVDGHSLRKIAGMVHLSKTSVHRRLTRHRRLAGLPKVA